MNQQKTKQVHYNVAEVEIADENKHVVSDAKAQRGSNLGSKSKIVVSAERATQPTRFQTIYRYVDADAQSKQVSSTTTQPTIQMKLSHRITSQGNESRFLRQTTTLEQLSSLYSHELTRAVDVLTAANSELLDENIQRLLASSNKKEGNEFAKVDLKQLSGQKKVIKSVGSSSF